jgi:hypothetical protein
MAERKDTNNYLRMNATVGPVTIEVEGTPERVEQNFEELCDQYLDGVKSEDIKQKESGGSTSSGTENRDAIPDRSLAEYYRKADEENDGISKADAALLTGWYLLEKEGNDNFIKSEVVDKANSAGLPLGSNPSRDLSNHAAADKAHLQKADDVRDGESMYTLTITGEDYVEEELLNLS